MKITSLLKPNEERPESHGFLTQDLCLTDDAVFIRKRHNDITDIHIIRLEDIVELKISYEKERISLFIYRHGSEEECCVIADFTDMHKAEVAVHNIRVKMA